MTEPSLANSFRLIDLDQILFGIEAAGTPHLMSLFGVCLARRTGVRPDRLFEALLSGAHHDTGGARHGLVVASAVIPDFGGCAWVAARIVAPLACGAIDGRPVDLAFAVVGGLHSLPARSAARSFARLREDREALGYLRAARTIDLFRAELTWALERAYYREPAKMTG